MPSPEAPITVPYTFFKEEVGKGNVEAIYSQGESITGRFKAPVTYPAADQKSAPPNGPRQPTEKKDAAPSADTQTKDCCCCRSAKRGQDIAQLRYHIAHLRRPRFGVILDRSWSRDQR
jgi:hypothetical protein